MCGGSKDSERDDQQDDKKGEEEEKDEEEQEKNPVTPTKIPTEPSTPYLATR
jgi:hypothetical protein